MFIDVPYQKVNIAKNEATMHAFIIGVGNEFLKYDVLTYDENILVFIQSICQVTYLNV
jgi:hypothetical protein